MTPADVLGVYDPNDPISLRTVVGLGIDIGWIHDFISHWELSSR